MTCIICCIKDVVLGTFGRLETFSNIEVAKRWFNSLKDEKFFSDFQLFKLGEYNIDEGKIVPFCEFILGGAKNEI